jgi:hypothetical protein
MLLVSKILTLNKIHILEKIFSSNYNSIASPIDYFHVGHPITDPPRIRGSITLKLDKQFIIENSDYFNYGSPIDIGSIKFGFFDIENIDLFIQKIECSYSRFINFLTEVEYLSPQVIAQLMHHRSTPEAREVLEKYFDHSVANFMLKNNDPHAWFFEFALNAGYSLRKEHIQEIIYPNTYSNVSIFQEIKKMVGDKAKVFNPKFSVDSRVYQKNSSLKKDFYIIGVYEDFKLDVFPTHVAPIMVEHDYFLGYRRWKYKIEKPYQIKFIEPVGKYNQSPESLFPVLTYQLCEPRKISSSSQVIAISKNQVLIESNSFILLIKLLVYFIKNCYKPSYFIRFWKTVKNIFDY